MSRPGQPGFTNGAAMMSASMRWSGLLSSRYLHFALLGHPPGSSRMRLSTRAIVETRAWRGPFFTANEVSYGSVIERDKRTSSVHWDL